jgi:predicted Zn-dependent peptidase
MVRPAFETIKSGNSLPSRLSPVPNPGATVMPKDLEQVHLCIGVEGVRATSRDRYALSLLNTILGGNMSSRLFQEVRERRSLAYAVYSFSSSHVDTGMFGSYAGISPENTVETLDVILAEVKNLCTAPVGAPELEDAKQFTRGNILLSMESTDNLMVRLAQNEIYFGRYIPLEEILDNIRTVTEADILELALRLFNDKAVGVSLLGPVPDQAPIDQRLSAFISDS